MIVAPGSTSVSIDVFFADDTGAALTGKVAADFPAAKWSGGSNAASTTITLSDLAAITTAHPNDNTAGGIKEREGGWYRLDLPNNMFTAAGHKKITFAETTNKRIIAEPIEVQYVQGDLQTIKTQTVTAAAGVTFGTVVSSLTAAQAATAVWQDATAGDFTAANSIGKCLYIANVAPGAAGGHFIAGSNAATTVNFTGSLSGSVGSVTGNVGGNVVGSVASVTAGVTLANTGHTITGLTINGQFLVTNSAGDAVKFESTGNDGSGLYLEGFGAGAGLWTEGGNYGIYAEGDTYGIFADGNTFYGIKAVGGQALVLEGSEVSFRLIGDSLLSGNFSVTSGITAAFTGDLSGDLGGKVLGGGSSSITGTGVRADIRAVAGQTASATGAVDFDQVGKVSTGGITTSSFAAGAINAAAIATDAITNTKIAAGAITSSEAPNLDVVVSTLATAANLATANTNISTINTKLGTPAASVSADIAAVKTDTGNLVTRITSTLFSGITSLGKLLGLIAGKAADAGTLTEMQAFTAGATYNNATDSQEAVRDRGDLAWLSGSGSSAADVADAVWTNGDRTLSRASPTPVGTQQFSAERTVVKGNNYGTGGRSFNVTVQSGADWPTDLSLYAWTFTADIHPDNTNTGATGYESITGTVSVTTATGASRALSVTVTSTNTAKLALGLYKYSVRGTQTGGVAWTVEAGLINVIDDAVL